MATNTTSTAGLTTQWHTVVLWFLGAIVLLSIAAASPKTAIMLTVILVVLVLLVNWKTYAAFLGIPQQ